MSAGLHDAVPATACGELRNNSLSADHIHLDRTTSLTHDRVIRGARILRKRKIALSRNARRMLSPLVVVMVCWEVMLSKDQQWERLGEPFWRGRLCPFSLRSVQLIVSF